MATEVSMIKESFNGNDGLFIGNDGNALSKLVSSTLNTQEDLGRFFKIMEDFHAEPEELTIHTSNRRLDSYLFHFSSKL